MTDTAPRRPGRPKGRKATPRTPKRGMRNAPATHTESNGQRPRGRTVLAEMPDGLMAQSRKRLAELFTECPTCHQSRGNRTETAAAIGISQMTMRKFLNGGSVSGEALERIYSHLARIK